LQVRHEFRVLFKVYIGGIADIRQLLHSAFIYIVENIVVIGKYLVYHSRTQELLQVVLAGIQCSEIGTDGLSLYGKLYFFIFNVRPQGSVELVGFSPSSCGWSSAAVKVDE